MNPLPKTQVLVTAVPQVRADSLPVPARSMAAVPAVAVEAVRLSRGSRMMGRWRWIGRRWAARLGASGRLGLGLAVLAATFYLAGVLPNHSDLAEKVESTALLEERVLRESERATSFPSGPTEELERFYRVIPPDSSISNALRTVYRISMKQSLMVEQAEYRVAAELQGKLLRYEVAFPVVGTYPQIRLFLREVAAELPFAVPDKVNFEYQDAKSGQVRATVRLLLYSQKEM